MTKEERKIYNKEYYERNKRRILMNHSKYARRKYLEDPEYRMRKLMASRTRYHRLKAEEDEKRKSS